MMIGAGVILVLIIAAAVAYFMAGTGSKFDDEMSNAISLMSTGRTEAARAAFGAIAHEYPDRAEPHVFLSRRRWQSRSASAISFWAASVARYSIRRPPERPWPMR